MPPSGSGTAMPSRPGARERLPNLGVVPLACLLDRLHTLDGHFLFEDAAR
jgi:hypothetical protein